MNFSKSDFIKALQAPGVLKDKDRRRKVLNAFAEFHEYKASPKDIAALTGYKPGFINLIFGHLSKAVAQQFNINDPSEFNSRDWWPILATGKKENNIFYWKLKKPFVEAAVELGIITEPALFPDEADTKELMEGERKQVWVNAYERNRIARDKCIEHYGGVCQVCNIDFEKVYGEIGKDFIHVHHIVKVSDKGGKKYKIDPINDLRPVCPNCHSMIHRVKESLSIEDLKKRIRFKYS